MQINPNGWFRMSVCQLFGALIVRCCIMTNCTRQVTDTLSALGLRYLGI